MPPSPVADPGESSEDNGSEIAALADENQAESAMQEDEDMGDGGEEEYEVELIRKHAFDTDPNTGKTTLKYLVKWKGYEKKSDQTWEPTENLTTAKAILDEYHESVGGVPTRSKPRLDKLSNGAVAKNNTPRKTIVDKYATTTAGKRMLGRPRSTGSSAIRDPPGDGNPDDSSASKPARVRRGPSHKYGDMASGTDEEDIKTAQKWSPPTGMWEDLIMSVDTVEKDAINGSLQVYLHWGDGRKSKHAAATCYQKAPQKMLQFYERHLVFKEGTHKTGSKQEEDMAGGEPAQEQQVNEEMQTDMSVIKETSAIPDATLSHAGPDEQFEADTAMTGLTTGPAPGAVG